MKSMFSDQHGLPMTKDNMELKVCLYGLVTSLQHEVFPSGHPSKYYPQPTWFDCRHQIEPNFFFPCGMFVGKKTF